MKRTDNFCENYLALHPLKLCRLDKKIKSVMLKSAAVIEQKVEDADLAGWEFKISLVKRHYIKQSHILCVAYGRFDDLHRCEVKIFEEEPVNIPQYITSARGGYHSRP